MANGNETQTGIPSLSSLLNQETKRDSIPSLSSLLSKQTQDTFTSTPEIRPEMPTFSEAFFGSLGEELTFGKLYNDPRLDADELSGAAKAGKMLGAGAAFFGVTALATVMTGGLGGLAILGSSAARLSQGAKIYNAAKKAGDVSKMAEGVAKAGIGVKNSLLVNTLGKNGVQKGYIDKFMKLAENDVAAARRYVLGREMGREALIFGATGQMMQEDDATFKQRAVAFGQDATAGALFAIAPAFKFANNPYIKSLGKSKPAELGTYFMSGFTTSLPNEEGMDIGSRVLTGALTTGLGSLFGGATMQASKQDIRRALERIGLTDEKKLGDYSQIAMGVINKQAIAQIDEQYKTIDFSSFDKKTGEVKTTAKVRKVYVEPKDGKLKVEYQTYYANGTEKDLVVKDFNKFNKDYKRSDDNIIQQIKYNFDKKGNKFSFFDDQDDLENFINTKKFGIITANEPAFFSNKAVGLYGETANETLIRELLARGYNRNQIMAVEGMYKGTADGRGFLVKGLKEKDAVELAKIFGQESVTTNKGLLNVKRPTRKVKQTVNGQNVVDADGNIQFDDVGYKVGAKKNEITSVAYNLRSQGKGNVLYGKDALATDYSTSIMSKNNDELSFSYLIDFAEDVGLRNPTMSKKQQLIRADEILLKSSEKVTGNKNFTLYKEIKALEKEAGLLTKSPLDQRHTALKVNVFGKKSLTEMTDDELQQYKALIDNQPSYTTKLHDENGGILFDNNPVIGNFKKFMNRIMPVSTKFGNLGRELGSEALVKIETDLTQMTRLREEIKGTYRASRNDMNKKYDFYDLTKEERGLLDKELIYHIDDRFVDLRSELNSKQKRALEDIKQIHQKFVNNIYDQMKKAGVQEKFFDGKNFQNQPIQKVKNFVSLTVSDEAADLFSKQDGPLRDSMIDTILKTDKRFKRGGEFFASKDKYKQAGEILDETLSHSAKHGIYGAQYSRTAKLPPKIFLDESGGIISGVDNMKLKVGDEFNGVKIGKVVDTYIEDYGVTMDRYAGRAASITSTTKFFGPEGVIKDGKFTKSFTQRIRKIENEVASNQDINYIKQELEKDMDIVLRGDAYDDIVSPVLRQATAWTAATGLSSFRSAIKNFFLGQVQNITTFGGTKFMRAMAKMATDDKFQKAVYERATKIGALDAGEQFVETVGIRGQGLQARAQRALTIGMKKTEQANRLLAVAVSEVAADDALKVLAGKSDGLFANIDKSSARRILEDVFKVDGLENAIKKGSFTEDQLNQIYFRGHTLTQGLADPTALPRFMSNAYAKPFTLFYRIAYRVTENVFENAYKPLVQNGEVAPMLRYIGASVGAGAAIQNMYYTVHNTDPDKFISAPERFWNYFVDGEGLGIFSALAETNRPIAQSLTPAIVQNGQNLLGAASLVAQGTFASETPGQRQVLLKEAGNQLTKAIPIANDIVNGIRKRTDKETETRFRTFRQKQGAYKSDILNTEYSGKFNYSNATTKSLMYRQLQANLYSDRSMEQKNKDFWAAVTYIQHQYEMANTTRISKDRAFKYAYNRALDYLEDSEPISLSKKRTQGRKISDYDDFVSRLDNDELQELKALEQTYKKKLREYRQYVKSQKNKYRP